MAKNSFYLAAKRSEYRNNFLPFDYYDFWITAKENENLRCQNKIRDYVHTPFDWDEDQDYYLESGDKFNHVNQATQTSERPANRKSRHTRFEDKENYEQNNHYHQHQHHIHKHNEPKQRKNQPAPPPPPPPPPQPSHQRHHFVNKNEESDEPETESEQLSEERNVEKPVEHRPIIKNSKNSGIQIYAPETQSFNVSKPRKVQSGFVKRSKSIADVKKEKLESKSITNMSVQTPPAWNLREYKNNKQKASVHRSASASMSDLKPKRAPFANYGWASRTKDLSNKPTHNALANKILASHNNKDAILELTLQKLKKSANLMANEYSAIESHAAEKYHTGRSDSKGWRSEYLEKYPDYSRSPSRNEIYMTQNPYRLNKSTLVGNYAPLRRGPKSAIRKVYYMD